MKYLGSLILLIAIIYGVGYLTSMSSQEFRQESLKQRMVLAAKKLHIVTGFLAAAILLVYLVRLVVHMIQTW